MCYRWPTDADDADLTPGGQDLTDKKSCEGLLTSIGLSIFASRTGRIIIMVFPKSRTIAVCDDTIFY